MKYQHNLSTSKQPLGNTASYATLTQKSLRNGLKMCYWPLLGVTAFDKQSSNVKRSSTLLTLGSVIISIHHSFHWPGHSSVCSTSYLLADGPMITDRRASNK